MEVRINIPEELAAEAQARGIRPEVYAEQLLARQIAAQPIRKLKTEQQIRDWLDSLAQLSDRIPPLPEVISREWLYQDHD